MSVARVDRYELDEPIASGGMATVYFARQRGAAGFSKVVAIKRMRPDLVHEREFVELFIDEARLSARVRHANVAGVIDVVAAGDELLLVMEYIHGESLARLLSTVRAAGARVPPSIAVAIVVGVLRGLHAAHEAKSEHGDPLGIVHRDVSPQNVLVGVDGMARVADFGIARAVGQLHSTEDGKTRGKPRYSAPELLRGARATRQADLFAASALLWETLVGRPLFEGDTQGAVVTAVLTEPVVAPGVFVPELPPALDDILLQNLDRDPRRRSPDALTLARALERALLPASPAVVATWVSELARDVLAAREATVARVEAGIARSVPAPQPSDEGTTVARSYKAGERRRPSVRLAEPCDDVRRATPARRLAVTALAIVCVVFGGAFFFSFARAAHQAAPIAAVTPSPVEGPARNLSPAEDPARNLSPVEDPARNQLPAEDRLGAMAWVSPPDPVVPDAVSLPPRVAPARVAAPVRAAPARARAQPVKRCERPYDLDSAGRKIFRVECL